MSQSRWIKVHSRRSLYFFFLTWAQTSVRADEILVSAAASLTDVLNEISKGYQSKSKNTVRFNYGPSRAWHGKSRKARRQTFSFR